MTTNYFAVAYHARDEQQVIVSLDACKCAYSVIASVREDGFYQEYEYCCGFESLDLLLKSKRWDKAWAISRDILNQHYRKLFMLGGLDGLCEYLKFRRYSHSCLNGDFFSQLPPYLCYEGYPLFAIGNPREVNTIMFLWT